MTSAIRHNDERYAGVSRTCPPAESLATTLDRVIPCWEDRRWPRSFKDGKNVLIAAHGNSLRALVKMLDDVSEEEITGFNIPTGVPIEYELDDDAKAIVNRQFLGDPEAVAAAAAAVAAQAKSG